MIFQGDATEILKTLPAHTVDCCVTSPPYWGLRDYGVAGQMGLEETPDEYVRRMVELFREVRRVLKDDGTLWLNIGDSYAAKGKKRTPSQSIRNSSLQGGKMNQLSALEQISKLSGGLKPKDMAGIPWMLAFALRADGWYLRQDIIWHKPNPMPESVSDRCTKAHEYIFLLSKSEKYYFDHHSIKEPAKYKAAEWQDKKNSGWGYGDQPRDPVALQTSKFHRKSQPKGSFSGKTGEKAFRKTGDLRSKRSVWSVPSKPFKGAHFATFPPNLIRPCILAGSREGGVVLDPFFGAGTTGLVAKEHGRLYIGVELNPEYIKIAQERLK